MPRTRIPVPRPWDVELRPAKASGWITNYRTWKTQSFICYDDGVAAFDKPLALPKRVRESVEAYCRRKMRRK